jgi:hypothetical protein
LVQVYAPVLTYMREVNLMKTSSTRYWPSLILIVSLLVIVHAQAKGQREVPHYIAVEARGCLENGTLRVFGASSLPAGSMIGLKVSAFDEDAWKDYSDEIYVAVDLKGIFSAEIPPKAGRHFARNLLVVADFTTFRPKQPAEVLQVVGEKGEHLGNFDNNPQLFQLSGRYYGLETIARVVACGH